MMQLEMTPLTSLDIAKLVLDAGFTRPMQDCNLQQLMAITDEQEKFEKGLIKNFGGTNGTTNNERSKPRKK